MSDNKIGFTFTWKIENFSMLPHQKGEELESTTFVVDMYKETGWHLVLYPRGDRSPTSEGHVSLGFWKEPQDTPLKLDLKLALESTDSSFEKNFKFDNVTFRGGRSHSNFISLIDLYQKKNLFLPNDIFTLRLELSKTDEENSKGYFTTKCFTSRTRILVHRRSMTWPILQENSIDLMSSIKELPSLKLSCNLSKISHDEYVPITIRQTCLPCNNKRLFVKCKMTVICDNKEYQDSAESTHLFSLKLDDVFHFTPFIKTSNLKNDRYLYLDDTLILQCEFAFSYKSDIYHYEFNHMPLAFETKQPRMKTQFVKSIEDLYMQGKYFDVQLQAGGEIFPAYKMLICARSNVFAAMFESNMKEKNSNVVEIADIEPTTLKRMLEFIHVDAVKEELSPEDACKLYKAADKYNIDCLKRMCSILLVSKLSIANMVDVLALADAHNDNFLKNAFRTFVFTLSIKVFHSKDWESFMAAHPTLSMNIMHQWIKAQQF